MVIPITLTDLLYTLADQTGGGAKRKIILPKGGAVKLVYRTMLQKTKLFQKKVCLKITHFGSTKSHLRGTQLYKNFPKRMGTVEAANLIRY